MQVIERKEIVKINILICNNRHFISGGPERYMFSVMNHLESNGHKVVPFSINCDDNRESIYSKYFANPGRIRSSGLSIFYYADTDACGHPLLFAQQSI